MRDQIEGYRAVFTSNGVETHRRSGDALMQYRCTLASLSMSPAVTAEVVVEADTIEEAEQEALDRRNDDDLKWFKDNGRRYRGEVHGDFAVADGIEPA